MILGNVIGHPLFHAKSYKNLLPVAEGDFSKDVAQLTMNSIPVVDKDTANRLGKRKLGEMSDLVSQFEISDDYTQINYKNTPYRITYLQYGDIIKWFNNQSQGLPGYLTVNMVTQQTSLVRFNEGQRMKYSPSEYFFRNISRYLRFKYPTKIFEDISFEIDESGVPYWIAPVIDYKIAIWSGKDITGAVLVNAITGESSYYSLEDIPTWVDQVFISDLILEQLNYYGAYQSGFINSIFGQKGVLVPTDGYNYLAIGDDVYLYTGLTSVTSDSSNVGFVLVNLRTKEAKYYAVPGAEEYSAMGSAEGQVQNLKYSATFPILLNISDRPTYFLSLKDAAGLVKMYAFVDVEQYQVVGTGSTVKDAMANYSKALGLDDSKTSKLVGNETIQGTIDAITSAVVEGNTCYYLTLKGSSQVYTVFIKVSEKLPFLKAGDQVSFTYATSEGSAVREITQIQ
ncbi:Cell shape-determining protein [Lachnospiraceae bacterium TWA4]|nr:Cell shape-determining protein [Lachnospiraceae bacterium TWA4]